MLIERDCKLYEELLCVFAAARVKAAIGCHFQILPGGLLVMLDLLVVLLILLLVVVDFAAFEV